MWYITLEKELELYLLWPWFWLDAMEYKRSYSISDGWQAVNGEKGGGVAGIRGAGPTLRLHSLACQTITYSCRKTAKIAKNGLSVGRVSIGLET